MSRKFQEFFPGEKTLFALSKEVLSIFATTLPPAIATGKDFARQHAGTLATVGNVFETGGDLVVGLSNDPRFIIPGALFSGIGKLFRQAGSRQQTISFRDSEMSKRRNRRNGRRSNNFGIRMPRGRRRTKLLRSKASNLMRIERLERALSDIPRKEVKNFDFVNTNFAALPLSASLPATKLTAMPQGNSLNERIGEQVNAVSLSWSINIQHKAVATGVAAKSVVRLVIFADSEAIDSASPLASAFFQNTSGLNDNLSWYNDKFPDRYLILVDRPYNVVFHEEALSLTDGGKINLRGMKMQYNGSLVTQTGKNNIFMFLISDSKFDQAPATTDAVVRFRSRLEFTG